MRANTVKASLAAGHTQVGSWIGIGGDPMSARLLARAGFPWLTIDMEHAPIDWSAASTLCGLIADAGCVPLIRVPEGTSENIKRALDGGAWGIVAPMVNTVDQARAIIAACRYPPQGTRSVGGGSHYLSFGCSDDEYKARANEEVLVVLQTESPEGVANAEAIYALQGCDAIFVGPNDLKWQMRSTLPGGRAPTDDEFEAMLSRVIEAGIATGTPVGIHTFSNEAAVARAQQGFRFIALSSDCGFLAAGAAAAVKAVAELNAAAREGGPARVTGGAAVY